MICTAHQIFRMITSRKMRWVGHVARIGVLLRKYREVRLRREDNKINFEETEREEVELINLASS